MDGAHPAASCCTVQDNLHLLLMLRITAAVQTWVLRRLLVMGTLSGGKLCHRCRSCHTLAACGDRASRLECELEAGAETHFRKTVSTHFAIHTPHAELDSHMKQGYGNIRICGSI